MNETNERRFRELIAAFESGDSATLSSLVHPDVVDHTIPDAQGIGGLLYAVAAYREGFPDLRISVDKVISDGDCVVGYGRITGTNTGSFFGTPPTGKTADFAYIDMYRIEHDLITEAWHLEDIAGLMRQASATPNDVPA